MPTACNIKNLNDPKLIFPLSIRSPPIWMTLERKNARYKRASLKQITPTLEVRVGKKYSMQLCVEDTKVFHHKKWFINSMSRCNVIIGLPFEAFGARLASKIFECSRRPTMIRKEGATFREKKSHNQLKKRPRLNASQKARKKMLNRSWQPREHANEMVLPIEPSLRCLYQDSTRMPLLLTIRG